MDALRYKNGIDYILKLETETDSLKRLQGKGSRWMVIRLVYNDI